MRRYSVLFTALVLLFVVTASRTTQAQDFRTLTIKNSLVVVDGDTLQRYDLPATLALDEVEGHFTFSGRFRPVLQVDGMFYTLDDRRPTLVEANLREAGHVGLFLRTPHTGLPDRQDINVTFRASFDGLPAPVAPTAGFQHADMPEVLVIRRHAAELEQQARVFQELSKELRPRLEGHFIEQIDQNAIQLFQQAEQTAAVADELPKLEVRAYLRSVERENRGLYDQLLRERSMEIEADGLAKLIKEAPEGPERDEHLKALRLKLRQIFELKQENRRREIVQFEQRLGDLQHRLREREDLRDAIIEERIRTLINEQ